MEGDVKRERRWQAEKELLIDVSVLYFTAISFTTIILS